MGPVECDTESFGRPLDQIFEKNENLTLERKMNDFTKATGLLIKMYFSKFSTLGFKLQLFLRFGRFFLQQFDILNIFFKKFFLRKYALTAKFLIAENLPVIVFEKFKISDFFKIRT